MRWDFPEQTDTPNLDRLTFRGVRAERLVPVFPTKTFPNHYSIATGLYVENHGIVANNMYDPEMDARFRLSDRDAVMDGRWWGGEPIWVTVEKQGLTAAAFFWPGTEAPIQGIRPTHWNAFDGSIANSERVAQVLEWFDLPVEERPSFVTLYFEDVDNAAHRWGTDHEETRAAIRAVDEALGWLLSGLDERGLANRVNIVVTSDHGMADISRDRMIFLDDYIDVESVMIVDWDPVAQIRPSAGNVGSVYSALEPAHPHLSVYLKEEVPERYHFRDNLRIPPIIAVADEGWSITTRGYYDSRPNAYTGATHGYDNLLTSMGALFIASGPAFKEGLSVPAFQNVHIYELLCEVLGLTPAPNDGSLDSVKAVLR
jgi:predicted AlkP superfamily pyrophosphatase or phosphodiesterase